MFYNVFGQLIDSENDSSKIDKNEIDLQYSTLLNDRILNKIKKMYNNINKSEGLKNIFKNTDKKLENKVNNLNFGYICPGAINTIKFIESKLKINEPKETMSTAESNQTKKLNMYLEKIKKYTDALFFVEIIYLYKDYINKEIFDTATKIEFMNQPCFLARKFTEKITYYMSKLPQEIKRNLPDNFYHIRHQTLVCSNDEKLGKDRIELMKKIYS